MSSVEQDELDAGKGLNILNLSCINLNAPFLSSIPSQHETLKPSYFMREHLRYLADLLNKSLFLIKANAAKAGSLLKPLKHSL